MLIGYVDESGHSKDQQCSFVGVGGLIAPTTSWEAFTPMWKSALDEFIGGEPFHMRDFVCVPGHGVYEGWDETKRRAFLRSLVAAINTNGIVPIACIVALDDYGLLHPAHQNMTKDPYYVAFQEVTKFMTVPQIVAEELEPVAMVYAYQKEFGTTEAGRAQQLWHIIKKNFGWGVLMGTYTPARPEDVLPLQAADLFAYEITREYENWLRRPEAKMRWGLKEILRNLDNDEPLIKLYTLPSLVEMIWNSGGMSGEAKDLLHLSLASEQQLHDARALLMLRARREEA